VAALAAHAQEAVLEPPAFQVPLELPSDIGGQRPACVLAHGEKRRIVLLDELVQQRLLGPVPRIPRRIDERRSSPRGYPLARHGIASLLPKGRRLRRGMRMASARLP
jgi:hypothetical protein